jgi:hypothetical protein
MAEAERWRRDKAKQNVKIPFSYLMTNNILSGCTKTQKVYFFFSLYFKSKEKEKNCHLLVGEY